MGLHFARGVDAVHERLCHNNEVSLRFWETSWWLSASNQSRKTDHLNRSHASFPHWKNSGCRVGGGAHSGDISICFGIYTNPGKMAFST